MLRYSPTDGAELGRPALLPANRRAGSGGFTLVELLITLAVTGILLAVAVPSLRTFVQNSRIDNTADTFIAAIQHARSEAITRGSAVILCRTADPATNSCGGSASKDWTPGWLMYAIPVFEGEENFDPEKGNSTGEPDKNHALVHRGMPAAEGVSITSDDHGNSWLTIGADGTLNESDTLAYAVCDERGVDEGKLIVIPMIGRPYATSDLSDAPNCEPS